MRNPGTIAIESGKHLPVYANRILTPAEIILLARYQEALRGRVLEVGCGAGRILGYLLEMGGDVHGIDLSQEMIDYCRIKYPEAQVCVGDMCDLPALVTGPFDVIYASGNVLDVLDDEERREILCDMRDLLAPTGLLLFSSHNLAHLRWRRRRVRSLSLLGLLRKFDRPPSSLLHVLMRQPLRLRNKRRMRPLEQYEEGYAIVNDDVHDNGLLLYYVTRDKQARQLERVGLELVECLDVDGHLVSDDADDSFDLHYVARMA